jgi:hypothetical protein
MTYSKSFTRSREWVQLRNLERASAASAVTRKPTIAYAAASEASGHNRTLFGIGDRLAISAPKTGLASEDQHKKSSCQVA